jgi:hypothetical protein
MTNSIWELLSPNLNIVFLSFYEILFPLNLTLSKITQLDVCFEMLTAFVTLCI